MNISSTELRKKIKAAEANLSIEDMHVDNDFIDEMIKSKSENETFDKIREKVIDEYAER